MSTRKQKNYRVTTLDRLRTKNIAQLIQSSNVITPEDRKESIRKMISYGEYINERFFFLKKRIFKNYFIRFIDMFRI